MDKSEGMSQLMKLLKVPCGPSTQGSRYVEIEHYVDFEPFGKASEDWEGVWGLVLPQQQAHWHGADGKWHPCNPGVQMRFKAETFDKVVAQAVAFLTDLENQVE